jgi:hypothetical protein
LKIVDDVNEKNNDQNVVNNSNTANVNEEQVQEQEDFDEDLAGSGVKKLFKSRYSSVSLFISKPSSLKEEKNLERLNDVVANIDEEIFENLKNKKVDKFLAAHIAHLFVRDPLVIFDDAIYLDDQQTLVFIFIYLFAFIAACLFYNDNNQ